ncbi:hypothetical protein E4T44_02698 [Aureobasidium sp. EXF-8845]|nr:hypothetical protein E4T44_02698 [Aureobasidium sp. EXF-8845]KAI4856367.1 hypothetical protein E4T45_02169 [Aureobasidium sp. EXF-8846]
MSFWSRPRNLMILGAGIVGAFFVPTPWSKSTPKALETSPTAGPQAVAQTFTLPELPPPVGTVQPQPQTKKTLKVGIPYKLPAHWHNHSNIKSNPSGINTEHFQEHQISQRPGEPGAFDKQWNKAHYGTEKGK